MKRTFIAIKIKPGDHIITFLNMAKKILKSESIKWVEENNLHLTLQFLGKTDEKTINSIITLLDTISSRFISGKFKVEGVGIFKKNRIPKIIWLDIKMTDSFYNMQKEIAESTKLFGFSPSNSVFKAHLTIGRIKFIKNTNQLSSLIKDFENYNFGEFPVKSFQFYESILTPKGPIYKLIREFELK